jgi:hypothetical protein
MRTLDQRKGTMTHSLFILLRTTTGFMAQHNHSVMKLEN